MKHDSGILNALAAALHTGKIRVVDLTQSLSPATPVIELPAEFANSPGVTITELSRYDARGPAWYWNEIRMGEHTGTHFDAPIHWVTGSTLPASACDTIEAAKFVGPAVVIDITAEVSTDEDFLLEPEHFRNWEEKHGTIPPATWVLVRSGWSKRYDTDRFLNVRGDGPHSPGLSPAAVRFLAYGRDVMGLGVETLGTDAGQAGGFDPPFPAHTIMHGAGKFGLASLCNLELLPETGAILIAAPLKLKAGSGSPVRALALISS